MNVHEILTAQILEEIKSGNVPWHKPWDGGDQRNYFSGHIYRGINILLLSSTPFSSPYWMTYNQVKKAGGNIHKGSKSRMVYFWSSMVKKKTNPETGAEEEDTIMIFRYYRIFNWEQTEGIPEKVPPEAREFNPIEEADSIISGYSNPPTIKVIESHRAFYRPSTDTVTVPLKEQYEQQEAFYAVMFHELSHSTGHSSRLHRKEITQVNGFGSHEYSIEELTAEMGAFFLCGRVGIAPAIIENSAAYIRNWSSVLKSNPRWLSSAASRGQKAADWILGKNEENHSS